MAAEVKVDADNLAAEKVVAAFLGTLGLRPVRTEEQLENMARVLLKLLANHDPPLRVTSDVPDDGR